MEGVGKHRREIGVSKSKQLLAISDRLRLARVSHLLARMAIGHNGQENVFVLYYRWKAVPDVCEKT